MPAPSIAARESIKTGLAMVITIGVALRMEFLEPSWAAYAVAAISLDSAGQSLNKAGLRIFGTLIGFVASLTFIGLFPQQRWAMLMALTPYVGFGAYMIAGTRRPYFWFVATFVCLTIMVHGGVESATAFRYALARLEENGLGILVYSLIAIFLWPRSSQSQLEAAAQALLETQRDLFRAYRGLLAGRGRPEDTRALRTRAAQGLTRLQQALDAARLDSYRVWELRDAWRELARESQELLAALGRWRTSLPEVRDLDLEGVLPGLEAFLAALDRRLAANAGRLGGGAAEDPPHASLPELEPDAVLGRSHFDRAALALFFAQLRRLDEAGRAVSACLGEIQGSGRIRTRSPARPPALLLPVLDPDRLRAALTVVATLWVAFFTWVQLDPPGHSVFWYQSTLWALITILTRQPPRTLLPGNLLAIAVAGVAYVGLMPHLSSYLGLGVLIFVAISGGFYLLWAPQRRGTRAVFATSFMGLLALDNHQSYSFAQFANSAACTLLSLGLTVCVVGLIDSPRHERVFLRLRARYFRRAEALMAGLAPRVHDDRWLDRWRSEQAWQDLRGIPAKLAALVDRIDYRLLPGSRPEELRALVAQLHDMTLRIQELVEARGRIQVDPPLERVVGDLRDWRLAARDSFRSLASDPAAGVGAEEIGERLRGRLDRLEAGLTEARRDAGGQRLRPDYEGFYRYVGAFRGLSEAGIGYAGAAAAVDWRPWQEARF